jgi:hypothetical protein
MELKVLRWLDDLLTPPPRPLGIAAYTIGVCPGCRRLRNVSSPKCETCGSTRSVPEDS